MPYNNSDQYFTTTIGGAEVAVAGVALPSESGSNFSRRTGSSGVRKAMDKVEDVLDGMKPVLSGVASKGWEILNSDIKAPDELTLTLGMGYSVETNMWVLGSKADLTFEVEMKWKRQKESKA